MDREVETFRFPLPEDRKFDEIIDVRAPVEFDEDHLSGAVNLPVLDDVERVQIGTRYKQVSAFEARKAGAALVSRNIQRHLDDHFAGKPEQYQPLIYCFRGGQRSRSLATVLVEIGWRVGVVEGGYKAYRRHVVDSIAELPANLHFEVINGLTGTGKTAVLRALAAEGAQVLDLEALANHRGSVFGEHLGSAQPSQKRFESLIYDQLSRFDNTRPVYAEAESPKIGRLNIPLPLRQACGIAAVTEIVSPLESRIDFLLEDYEPWLSEPDRVLARIERLATFHGKETIARWQTWCRGGQWRELIGGLLSEHYDRHYGAGGKGNYRKPENRHEIEVQCERAFRDCARALMERESSRKEESGSGEG